MKYVLGIDLGGTNIKIGCFDTDLNLIGKISVPTQCNPGPDAVVEQFYTASKQLVSDNGLTLDDIKAVGVGTPGPVNLKEGTIVAAPNLPNFKNTPLRDMVAKRFDKPAIMENDANAACWAEHVAGAAKGGDQMVMLTLGTGVGGGIVCDGHLLHGPTGGAAELGHIIVEPGGRDCGCGQKGCVETYASASSTALRAEEAVKDGRESSLSTLDEITCKDVFVHAEKGDALANEIVDSTAKVLGLVCVQLANMTDPDCVVFAGGMIAAGDFLLERIRKNYMELISPLTKLRHMEICYATLGEDAGIIGAASLANLSMDNYSLLTTL
jgi:glucokinase